MSTHNGAVTVQSIPKMGTTFTLYFPVEHVLTPEGPETETIEFGNGEHILLIDDNENVLLAGEELLKYLGYTVSAFSAPHDAIATFMENPDLFSLIITDLSMPKLTGVDVAQSVRKIRPNMPVILTSGFGIEANIGSNEFTETLTKPFLLKKLSQVAHQAINRT